MKTPIPRQVLAHVQARIIALTGLDEARVCFLSPIDPDQSTLPNITLFSINDSPKDEDGTASDGSEVDVFSFGVTITVESEDEAATDPLAILTRQAVLEDPFLGGLSLNVTRGAQEWGAGTSGSIANAMTKLLFNVTYLWSPEW